LAIVNSTLVSWYANLKLPNFGKEIFPKLNPNDIKDIPIPKCSNDKKVKIEKVVELILKLKKQDSSSDTSNLESQIDKLVYELYGLNEDEIQIIENK